MEKEADPFVTRFLNADGQVIQWPAKEQGKTAVLEYLSEKFEDERSYAESEVNEVLKTWHTFDDWALLRRELFDRMYFDRELDGSGYRKRAVRPNDV